MLHFRVELQELHTKLLEMGALVESAIHSATQALLDRDERLAQEVMWKESQINQREIELDDLAIRLLALFQPMARDLRFITAVMKMNSDLERMGDLAVNIAERAVALKDQPPVDSPADIPKLWQLAGNMVHRSLDAFAQGDAEMARAVLLADDEVDDLRDAVYGQLLRSMQDGTANVDRAVLLMFIAQDIERIADHATNIAEDVLFLVRGIDVRHHAEARE